MNDPICYWMNGAIVNPLNILYSRSGVFFYVHSLKAAFLSLIFNPYKAF
jgi:hypothetical protein